MEFVPHPRPLWHSTNPVCSGLRAENESLFCPRNPRLPASWEFPSTVSSQVAPRHSFFLTLCCLPLVPPLFFSFCSPLTWLVSVPQHCTSLGEAMEEAGVTFSLWALAADLLGCYLQPLLLIQNLLIQVGRMKCIMGFLWKKETNCDGFSMAPCFTSLIEIGGCSAAFQQGVLFWVLKGETPLDNQDNFSWLVFIKANPGKGEKIFVVIYSDILLQGLLQSRSPFQEYKKL